MANSSQNLRTILNATATAPTTGAVLDVKDFQNIVLQIGTASSANLTVKIQGSVSDIAPTFSSPATVNNHWAYLACYELDSSVLVPGSTGFVTSGTDSFVNYLVNVSGINFITATVTARSAGSVTVKAKTYDND